MGIDSFTHFLFVLENCCVLFLCSLLHFFVLSPIQSEENSMVNTIVGYLTVIDQDDHLGTKHPHTCKVQYSTTNSFKVIVFFSWSLVDIFSWAKTLGMLIWLNIPSHTFLVRWSYRGSRAFGTNFHFLSKFVVSEKKNDGPGRRQTQRECPGKLRAKSTKVWTKKIHRFRSGDEHSPTGGEQSPVRAHTSIRSRSWACRNHKTLTNLWRSKGLRRWVLLSNVRMRTFSLPSLLWLGLGATACVEGILPASSWVCDWSDKRRKDTKKSEFDKERT